MEQVNREHGEEEQKVSYITADMMKCYSRVAEVLVG
jgi:hypothetical protein